MRKILSTAVNTFIRLNKDIVAGIWQTALVMPLDCAMFIHFTGEPSYQNLDYRFWIFFSIYTLFFLGGYAFAPLARKKKLKNLLNQFVVDGNITNLQAKKIWDIVKDNSRYAPLWSKSGMLLFLMENIYCMSIIFAFFGGEGLINACLNGTEKAMSILHLCFASGCLILESQLDKYIAKRIRRKYKMGNMKIFYGANKQITTQLIADITGDSSSNNLMNLHLESMLEDITEILDVSSKKEEAKKIKKKSSRKVNLLKGRIEKAKKGINIIKKNKNNKKKVNLKHTKTKKKNNKQFKKKINTTASKN